MKYQTTLPLLLLFVSCFLIPSCLKDSNINSIEKSRIIATVFQPGGDNCQDAIIESLSPDQNFGHSEHLSVFSWTNGSMLNTSRAFIKFDLSKISYQTNISSAKLSLYGISYGNLDGHSGENAFTIYRIVQNWVEDSITWNNQPSITNIDSVAVQKSSFTYQSYLDVDVTNIAQYMINNPTKNYGFMLKLNEEFPYKSVVIASSDYTESNKRPKLAVFY